MRQRNLIELNGIQYDALTGKALVERLVKATPASRSSDSHDRRSVDGFSRSFRDTQPLSAATYRKDKTEEQQSKSGTSQHIHHQATAIHPHHPEHPKTLMRQLVTKPAPSLKPAIKTTAPAEILPISLKNSIEKKFTVAHIDPLRLTRANYIARSQHIQRFSRMASRPDKPAPVKTAGNPPSQPAAPAFHPITIPPRPVAQPPARSQARKLFEGAMAQATSHQEPRHKSKSRRTRRRRVLLSAFACCVAILVFGGFMAYLNMSKIEIRIASVRAGFIAQMPSYEPTGYALDTRLSSSPGKVELTFRSGSSAYKLTQAPSTWDSATLLAEDEANYGAPQQIVQKQDLTVYVYSATEADWVNNGVLYQVTGNAFLGANRLVDLATSV